MQGCLKRVFPFSLMLCVLILTGGTVRAAIPAPMNSTILAPSREIPFTLSDLRPFTLIIDQAYRTDMINGSDLSGGYRSHWFSPTPYGLHLASMTRHPEPWRHVKPATMLRLNTPLLLTARAFHMEARLRIGKSPDHVNLDIARFRSGAAHTPMALFAQGDTLRFRHCMSKKKCKVIVAGTMAKDREARIIIDVRPGHAMDVTVNGTHSFIPLTSEEAGQKLYVETGIGSDNDLYAVYAPESAELLSLTIKA